MGIALFGSDCNSLVSATINDVSALIAAMSHAVSTKTKAELDLERIEEEINAEAFEAFYHIGQKLLDIRENRRYEAAGFKSWTAYCKAGRLDYKKAQADHYIQASELRPKLPTNCGHEFTESHMRELCKCETDRDAKRVAKKAIARAKKTGERVTAKLIAMVRDDAGETGAAGKRQDAKLQEASLESHLEELADLLVEWRISASNTPTQPTTYRPRANSIEAAKKRDGKTRTPQLRHYAKQSTHVGDR